ncbi:MAG: hypothetical protein ACYDC5_01175 [Candidatus Dormibacteria bacterium]
MGKQESGHERAQRYDADESDGVCGFGAFFLLLDTTEVYGMPPAPSCTRRDLAPMLEGCFGSPGLACWAGSSELSHGLRRSLVLLRGRDRRAAGRYLLGGSMFQQHPTQAQSSAARVAGSVGQSRAAHFG